MSGSVFTFVREFVAAFVAEARRVFGGETGIESLTQEPARSGRHPLLVVHALVVAEKEPPLEPA